MVHLGMRFVELTIRRIESMMGLLTSRRVTFALSLLMAVVYAFDYTMSPDTIGHDEVEHINRDHNIIGHDIEHKSTAVDIVFNAEDIGLHEEIYEANASLEPPEINEPQSFLNMAKQFLTEDLDLGQLTLARRLEKVFPELADASFLDVTNLFGMAKFFRSDKPEVDKMNNSAASTGPSKRRHKRNNKGVSVGAPATPAGTPAHPDGTPAVVSTPTNVPTNPDGSAVYDTNPDGSPSWSSSLREGLEGKVVEYHMNFRAPGFIALYIWIGSLVLLTIMYHLLSYLLYRQDIQRQRVDAKKRDRIENEGGVVYGTFADMLAPTSAKISNEIIDHGGKSGIYRKQVIWQHGYGYTWFGNILFALYIILLMVVMTALVCCIISVKFPSSMLWFSNKMFKLDFCPRGVYESNKARCGPGDVKVTGLDYMRTNMGGVFLVFFVVAAIMWFVFILYVDAIFNFFMRRMSLREAGYVCIEEQIVEIPKELHKREDSDQYETTVSRTVVENCPVKTEDINGITYRYIMFQSARLSYDHTEQIFMQPVNEVLTRNTISALHLYKQEPLTQDAVSVETLIRGPNKIDVALPSMLWFIGQEMRIPINLWQVFQAFCQAYHWTVYIGLLLLAIFIVQVWTAATNKQRMMEKICTSAKIAGRKMLVFRDDRRDKFLSFGKPADMSRMDLNRRAVASQHKKKRATLTKIEEADDEGSDSEGSGLSDQINSPPRRSGRCSGVSESSENEGTTRPLMKAGTGDGLSSDYHDEGRHNTSGSERYHSGDGLGGGKKGPTSLVALAKKTAGYPNPDAKDMVILDKTMDKNSRKMKKMRSMEDDDGASSDDSAGRIIQSLNTRGKLKNGSFRTLHSSELVPGDIIEIPEGCTMPCDAVLLDGHALVNEADLTGEPMPVSKYPIEKKSNSMNRDEFLDLDKHRKRHLILCGTIVLQSLGQHKNKQNMKAVGLVIQTGLATQKGSMMKKILYPAPVRYSFDDQLGCIIIVAVVVLQLLSVLPILGFAVENFTAQRTFQIIVRAIFEAISLTTIVASPLMLLGLVQAQVRAAERFKKSPSEGVSLMPQRIPMSGEVQVQCLDKTGTITEDGLQVYGMRPVYWQVPEVDAAHLLVNNQVNRSARGIDRGMSGSGRMDSRNSQQMMDSPQGTRLVRPQEGVDMQSDERIPRFGPIIKLKDTSDQALDQTNLLEVAMATCHTITSVGAKLYGNAVEKEMVRCLNLDFVARIGEGVEYYRPKRYGGDGELLFKTVRQFEFDQTIQMQSVVVDMRPGQQPALGNNPQPSPFSHVLFSKGSFEAVATRCIPETLPPDSKKVAKSLAIDGFYVIALAYRGLVRNMKAGEANGIPGRNIQWHSSSRVELEKDLVFLGLIYFRNELKSDSSAAISELKNGTIAPVIVTGDTMWTGVFVAEKSGILPKNGVVLTCDLEETHQHQHNSVDTFNKNNKGNSKNNSAEVTWQFLREEDEQYIPIWINLLADPKAKYASRIQYFGSDFTGDVAAQARKLQSKADFYSLAGSAIQAHSPPNQILAKGKSFRNSLVQGLDDLRTSTGSSESHGTPGTVINGRGGARNSQNTLASTVNINDPNTADYRWAPIILSPVHNGTSTPNTHISSSKASESGSEMSEQGVSSSIMEEEEPLLSPEDREKEEMNNTRSQLLRSFSFDAIEPYGDAKLATLVFGDDYFSATPGRETKKQHQVDLKDELIHCHPSNVESATSDGITDYHTDTGNSVDEDDDPSNPRSLLKFRRPQRASAIRSQQGIMNSRNTRDNTVMNRRGNGRRVNKKKDDGNDGYDIALNGNGGGWAAEGGNNRKIPMFYFAMTEKAYNFLADNDPDLLQKLLRRIIVFGRCSPSGKVDIVRRYMALGLVVGFVGDGGNDCGALRAAHAGLALSEGDASIVAPFSSSTKSLYAVVEMIRQGRCCLAISTSLFEFHIAIGIATAAWKVLIVWQKAQPSEILYLLKDSIMILFIVFGFIAAAPPTHKGVQRNLCSCLEPEEWSRVRTGHWRMLNRSIPSGNLLQSARVFRYCMLGLSFIVIAAIMLAVVLPHSIPHVSDWFSPMNFEVLNIYDREKELSSSNYLSPVLISLLFVFTFYLFVALNVDGQHRQGMFSNCWVWLTLLLFIVPVLILLFTFNTPMNAAFRMNVDNVHSWKYHGPMDNVIGFVNMADSEVISMGHWFTRPLTEEDQRNEETGRSLSKEQYSYTIAFRVFQNTGIAHVKPHTDLNTVMPEWKASWVPGEAPSSNCIRTWDAIQSKALSVSNFVPTHEAKKVDEGQGRYHEMGNGPDDVLKVEVSHMPQVRMSLAMTYQFASCSLIEEIQDYYDTNMLRPSYEDEDGNIVQGAAVVGHNYMRQGTTASVIFANNAAAPGIHINTAFLLDENIAVRGGKEAVSDMVAHFCQRLCEASWRPDKSIVAGTESSGSGAGEFEESLTSPARFYCWWVAVSRDNKSCFLVPRTDAGDNAALGPDLAQYVNRKITRPIDERYKSRLQMTRRETSLPVRNAMLFEKDSRGSSVTEDGNDLKIFFLNRHNVLSWEDSTRYFPKTGIGYMQTNSGNYFPRGDESRCVENWCKPYYEHYPSSFVPIFSCLLLFVLILFAICVTLVIKAANFLIRRQEMKRGQEEMDRIMNAPVEEQDYSGNIDGDDSDAPIDDHESPNISKENGFAEERD